MSDFLVNLARRSAGLAPVVRARLSPASIVAEAPSELRTPSAARKEAAPTPLHIIQRSPAASSPAASAPPATPVHVAEALPGPLRVQPTVETVRRETTVVHRTDPASPASPPILPPIARSEAIVPGIPPAPRALVEPAQESSQDEPRHESMREPTQVNERVIESAAHVASEPVVVTIRPATPAVPMTTVSRVESNPERTVNVRIGAIEIYAPEKGAEAPKLSAAAPAIATSVASSTPAGGFDDYAALRSYAPWVL